MMWRFSFASTSTLDSLLGRETPPSVEEIMDDSDVLQECKSQNNKLVNFLSKDDSIKSLLHWVVSGLDELDEQSRQAERTCLAKARGETDTYPIFGGSTSSESGAETSVEPLEPAKVAEDNLAAAQEGSEGGDTDLSAGNMGMLSSAAPQEGEEDVVRRARYPTVAAEILTSEIWVIPETILQNKDTLLRPFWDTVIPPVPTGDDEVEANSAKSLYETSEGYRARVEYGSDDDDERDRKREIIRGLWVKVNGNLLTKRTHEMVRFIQSIPNVIPRLMAQIHSPAIQDILIRLISAEEAGVTGVVQWLAEEGLIKRLISFLSPLQPPHIHVLATELLKNIITLCAPPPFNPLGGNMQEQQSAQGATSGTRDNRMVRELVREESIRQLVGYMLDPLELSDADWPGLNGDGTPNPADPFIVHPLPSTASAASSLSHISTIFVELIRRNNSDFAEPHLFHTLRNRLMNMRMEQGAPLGHMEEGEDAEARDRARMEEAVQAMAEAMGIVHLRWVLNILAERFDRLDYLLKNPRTQKHSASPSCPLPLTLERFRIVELYAELLHSSNMGILQRPLGTGPQYSPDGILMGGLAGLELLGEAIDEDRDMPSDNVPEGQVTQARELPVSSNASTSASLSGEDLGSDSEDEKMLEDIEEMGTPSGSPSRSGKKAGAGAPEHQPPPPSEADAAILRDVMTKDPISADTSDIGGASNVAVADTTAAPSAQSDEEPNTAVPRPSSAASVSPVISPPGIRLKEVYLERRIIPALIDMFFEHASNDFLHHVVYDMLQQILNGSHAPGTNRDLLEEMMCGARLVERVLEAQRRNTQAVTVEKGPRIPYMGHIILIAEEIVKFLATSNQKDLIATVLPFVPQPAWDEFVAGQLQETRARDTQPLAGGKPLMGTAAGGDGSGSKSEDEESGSDSDDDDGNGQLGGFGTFGEPLQRTKAAEGYAMRDRQGSGSEDDGSEDETNERYWRNTAGLRRNVDSESDDDDDADWLRPTDEFGGLQSGQRAQPDDFDDDDTWGSFSSAGANNAAENPFGDDNFAPSVTAASSSSSAPSQDLGLTPAQWFDREFSSAWDDDSGPGPAIVVPAGADEEDDDEAEAEMPRTPGSTWSFTGDEGEGEDLPAAVSPVIGEDGAPGDSATDATVGDLSGGVQGLGISDATSTTPPIAIPSSSRALDTASSDTLSTSPNAPIPDRNPPSDPPASPKPHRSSKPPPPPPSPRRKRAPSVTGPNAPALGVSPPDASLGAAASKEEPLGPGVGADVEVTDDGMLRREVDGKEVVVPKDEVVMGVEEEAKGL